MPILSKLSFFTAAATALLSVVNGQTTNIPCQVPTSVYEGDLTQLSGVWYNIMYEKQAIMGEPNVCSQVELTNFGTDEGLYRSNFDKGVVGGTHIAVEGFLKGTSQPLNFGVDLGFMVAEADYYVVATVGDEAMVAYNCPRYEGQLLPAGAQLFFLSRTNSLTADKVEQLMSQTQAAIADTFSEFDLIETLHDDACPYDYSKAAIKSVDSRDDMLHDVQLVENIRLRGA